MSESTADAPVPGATQVVEAATAEGAIGQVHDLLGPDARILEARRVLRGGIGGFFAKEHVQLHVAPGSAAGATASPTAPPAPNPLGAAGGAPVDRLLAGAEPEARRDGPVLGVADDDPVGADRAGGTPDDGPTGGPTGPEELDFATFLRRQLGTDAGAALHASGGDGAAGTAGDEDAVVPAELLDRVRAATLRAAGERPAAAATPVRSEPRTAPVSTPPDAVAWERVVDAVAAVPVPFAAAPDGPRPHGDGDAEGSGDAAHQTDVPAWSARELLRLGLPVDLVRSLGVSDDADDLAWTSAVAEVLRPLCRPLPMGASVLVGPHAGDLAGEEPLDGAPAARSATWRNALGRERWTHLVVGGAGWRSALRDDVLAVSWATVEDLPEAVRCAAELGLVLGSGPLGGAVRRATPLDVALAVRSLVVAR